MTLVWEQNPRRTPFGLSEKVRNREEEDIRHYSNTIWGLVCLGQEGLSMSKILVFFS